MRRLLRIFALLFLAPLGAHLAWYGSGDWATSWHTADWSSARLLEPAVRRPEATVHVLAAPTGHWKGGFSVHSWIVLKERGAGRYTRYDVAGWGRPVKVDGWAPDARWYGHEPHIVGVVTGTEAERLIPRIRQAILAYPHARAGDYRLWPGPNSNTFVAEVLAQIPEAGIVLPANAIGKDWRGSGLYLGPSPTGTGVQLSLLGVLGLTVGWREGLELNVLGLVAGLDVLRPALKLPGWGRIGV